MIFYAEGNSLDVVTKTDFLRRWMLGDLLCIITAYLQFIPNMMEMILMATLPLQRLYVMQWPLSSHANSSKRRKLSIRLTAILWAVMIVVGSGLGFRNGRQGVEFAIPRFICQPLWLRTSTTQGMVIRPLVLLLFQVAPLLTTSVANIWVLVICSRTKDPRQPGGSQLKARSIVTILIVTTIFLMSVLPGTILMFVIVFRGGAKDEDPLRNHFVATISMHLSFLNVVVNYYVYKYTGKRVGNGQTRPYPRSRSDMPVIMSNNARNDNPRKSMPMINLAAARNAQLQDKNKNILPKITDLAPESPT